MYGDFSDPVYIMTRDDSSCTSVQEDLFKLDESDAFVILIFLMLHWLFSVSLSLLCAFFTFHTPSLPQWECKSLSLEQRVEEYGGLDLTSRLDSLALFVSRF